MYILKGLRPMPPTRTLNTSRRPDRLLQVTLGGSRNQPCDPSIVRAHSVRTIGVLENVPEGVPWRFPGAPGILGGRPGSLGYPWGFPVGSLGGPWGVPGGSVG